LQISLCFRHAVVYMRAFRQAARVALTSLGLLRTVQLLRIYLREGSRGLRRNRLNDALPQRAAAFAERHAKTFRSVRAETAPDARRVLVVGDNLSACIELELCFAKALELAGWRTLRLHEPDSSKTAADAIATYYRLLDSAELLDWDDNFDPSGFRSQAESIVDGAGSLEELLAFETGAVRVGGHAISTARRQLRAGAVDLEKIADRHKLTECVASSLASAEGFARLVGELGPSLILTVDTAYTPRAEMLDVCVRMGIPVIRWYVAHKDSAVMLKRYTAANRDQDINSLSPVSWQFVCNMEWSAARHDKLMRELSAGYARKDWYNQDGAQFNKRQIDAADLRKRLGLDPSRKTAIVFPHVAYDASFGRGEDLFPGYDEWLVETIKVACANENVQWVIRIHPAHLGKHLDVRHVPDEEAVLRRQFGDLPRHVSIIPAGSDISTLSLFSIMDYCLTVRGTVGIEAACRGIPVLTGGTGRYDRKGFTIDSVSAAEYLDRLARIQDIAPLLPAQIELAGRFAYGLFLLRPLPLTNMTVAYDKESAAENFSNPVEIRPKTRKDWETAPDLKAFVEWATGSDSEDFLLPDLPDTDELPGHAP